MRHTLVLLIAGLALLLAAPAGAQSEDGDLILFRTNHGDIVVELFDDAAPETAAQIRELIDAGAYDNAPIGRNVVDFIVQLGALEHRTSPPLTSEQSELIDYLPVEIDPSLRHVRGVLSMARYDATNLPDELSFLDDPDRSGTTSFSFLVADAPHLDDLYTVFGRVVEGMAVVDHLNTMPTGDGDVPGAFVAIASARRIGTAELAEMTDLRTEPFGEFVELAAAETAVAFRDEVGTPTAVTASLIAALVLGIAAFVTSGRLSPRFSSAFALLAALAAGFGLMVTVVPSSNETVGLLVFAAIFGFLRLLSRFESVAQT